MGTPDLIYDHAIIVGLAREVAPSVLTSPVRLDGLVGNLNGGLVPLALVHEETGIPIVGVVQTRRYRTGEKQSLQPPVLLRRIDPRVVAGLNIGLVDDVADENLSIDCAWAHLIEAGARSVRTIVLDWKPEKSKVPGFRPDHVARVHKGTPWIHYGPWEDSGVTHERALEEFVKKEHLVAKTVSDLLTLVREGNTVAA